MDHPHLKSVHLKGIHKRYNLDVDFNSNLNVLHGHNGTGKSTLIHIIANVANCDFVRFAFLEFEEIKVIYSNDKKIVISQLILEDEKCIKIVADDKNEITFSMREAFESTREDKDDFFFEDITPDLPKRLSEFSKINVINQVETSYFPAFRTMLEAWSSQNESRGRLFKTRGESIKRATEFSRNLFGHFLPKINFPSPIDIEKSLREEIRDAQMRIARYESSIFSESFVKVFSALLEKDDSEADANQLLTEISDLSSTSGDSKLGEFEEGSIAYRKLRELVNKSNKSKDFENSAARALSVYRDALKDRKNQQQNAFKAIDKYFEVVNSFLDKKELSYELDRRRRMPKVGLKFPDNTWSRIQVMSSGERQLLTMLYAVNKMSGNSIVLIDEPELSLHIDWQEELLGKMMEQLGDRQIIVCTHSPSIAEDFDDYMEEVVPKFINKESVTSSDDDSDYEEEDLF